MIYGHNRAGCATKQYVHYGQIIKAKRFQKFDYGKTENIIRYGSSIPPEYDLKNATAKMILYYVENDGIIYGSNVRRFTEKLSNAECRKVTTEEFDHGDYVWGKLARSLIYDDLIEYFRNK